MASLYYRNVVEDYARFPQFLREIRRAKCDIAGFDRIQGSWDEEGFVNPAMPDTPAGFLAMGA